MHYGYKASEILCCSFADFYEAVIIEAIHDHGARPWTGYVVEPRDVVASVRGQCPDAVPVGSIRTVVARKNVTVGRYRLQRRVWCSTARALNVGYTIVIAYSGEQALGTATHIRHRLGGHRPRHAQDEVSDLAENPGTARVELPIGGGP